MVGRGERDAYLRHLMAAGLGNHRRNNDPSFISNF